VTEEMFDELVDEDTRAELIDGVMVVHSPASPRHDNIAGFLRALLRCFADDKEQGLVLGPDSLIRLTSRQKFAPDLFFLTKRHVPRRLPCKRFEGAPDLVVEVLSPSNRHEDLQEKRPAYRKAGVQEIWLIDPEGQEVVVDRRVRKRYATDTVVEG
jgi:Uma2 family endonuclease